MDYQERVWAYEAQGLTTSDAQAVCDAEDMKARKGDTMTYTNGPWRVVKRSNQRGVRNLFVDTGKGGAWHRNSDHLATAEDEANARLIAAAPELLEALERLWMTAERHIVSNELKDRVRAALAKAQGR